MIVSKYFDNMKLLRLELDKYKRQKALKKEFFAKSLVKAHMDKAKHNLKFVSRIRTDEEFNDWIVVGLYYAAYHAALALVANKGHVSKNHDATLIFIMHEYHLEKNEIELLDRLSITKTDAEFYASLKKKRHEASYSTNIMFRNDMIKEYINKTIDFINKTEEMLESSGINIR